MSNELSSIAVKIEKLSSLARLSDLSLFMTEGQITRAKRIRSVLGHLEPGVYLIGAGPYTQGVHSLMCDEVVIGRLATVLEETTDRPVDVFVNDATTLAPTSTRNLFQPPHPPTLTTSVLPVALSQTVT